MIHGAADHMSDESARARRRGPPTMTETLRWRGIFPAALTMFDREGRVDEDATSAHLDRLIGAGAHGVVVGGTSGEFIGLTERERLRLVEVAVAAVAGR